MPLPPNLMNKVKLVRQQTKTLLVTVKTSEGAPAKLTGASAVMTIRQNVTSDVLVTKTTDDGISITCAEGGQMTITLSTTDTDLSPGCYAYDVWVMFPTDPPTRHPVVKMAELVVEPAITEF